MVIESWFKIYLWDTFYGCLVNVVGATSKQVRILFEPSLVEGMTRNIRGLEGTSLCVCSALIYLFQQAEDFSLVFCEAIFKCHFHEVLTVFAQKRNNESFEVYDSLIFCGKSGQNFTLEKVTTSMLISSLYPLCSIFWKQGLLLLSIFSSVYVWNMIYDIKSSISMTFTGTIRILWWRN